LHYVDRPCVLSYCSTRDGYRKGEMTDLGTALEAREQPAEQRTISQLLDAQRPQIERALPAAFLRRDPDRFVRVVMTEIRRNPTLLECTPESLLGALMLSAQLGLEPGPLGWVYLSSFKKECTLIIGYKGYIELGYRSGRLGSIRTATVFEGDEFVYEERESGPFLRHRETRPADRGQVVCYYSRATIVGGKPSVKRLWPEDVEAAKSRSPMGKLGKGPWHSDYESMAWKTCIRRHAALLPQSVELARAVAVDETAAVWEHGELKAEAVSLEATTPDEEKVS
jgi:recombination protein RecT